MFLARDRISSIAALGASAGGGPPLDLYTTGLTGAWSMHRQLLTSYGGAFNTNTGSVVGTIHDQSGGGRNFTAAGALRPALSTLGLVTSATFNSTGWPSMDNSSTLSSFITTSAGFWVWVGSIDALPPSFARLIHNSVIETIAMYSFANGLTGVFNDDGTNDQTQVQSDTPVGSHVITWRHESGTLYASVDGGTENSIASGNTSALTGTVQLSNAADSTKAFDGKFVELYVWSTVPSSGDRTAIIAQAKTLLGITTGTTSYTNTGGYGNRTSIITITTDVVQASGAHTMLINGTQADEYWWNAGQTSRVMMFDFGVGASKVIDEFKWYQDSAASQGTWQMQGSNNGSSFTTFSGSFTLGSAATTTVTLTNSTGYRYYRLTQTGGTTSGGPYVREIAFKISV